MSTVDEANDPLLTPAQQSQISRVVGSLIDKPGQGSDFDVNAGAIRLYEAPDGVYLLAGLSGGRRYKIQLTEV